MRNLKKPPGETLPGETEGLRMYLDELKRIIAEQGYTQTRLAKRIDITPGHLNKALNGKFPMTKRNLLAICEVLHISLEDLGLE